MTVNAKSNYIRFIHCLKLWLPKAIIHEISCKQENIELNRCIKYQETYYLHITLQNKQIIKICGMTRKGYFICNGKAYVWPWKETYIPNFIYKYDTQVEVWSALLNKPWEMYKGRIKLSIHKETLCIEGSYDKWKMSLISFITKRHITELPTLLQNYTWYNDFHRLLHGKWEHHKGDCFENHPFLPHALSRIHKTIFLSLMICNLFDETIKPFHTNDVCVKRIIGIDWLVGHTANNIEDPKINNYLMKRIYTHGQLVQLSSAFEILSHVTRVIRGKPIFGVTDKRELHKSHQGVYCPYRASEGETIGLKVDLVPDVSISMYNTSIYATQNDKSTIVNGCIPNHINALNLQDTQLNYFSKEWTWTDGGIIYPGNINSVGYVAQQLIYPRHMPPVRSMYATTHIRQAIQLAYKQIPIVTSHKTNQTIINGTNAIVAISGFHGWNIEDAIVCNKSFLERGGLSSVCTTKIAIRKETGEQWIGQPPKIGTILFPENICVAKRNESHDTSIRGYKGIVQQSYRIKNDSTTIVILQYIHIPEVGDKLSTRSGQKGVIGHISLSENMPCTLNGVVPDIIINPAHLPSRMTVSQLFESFFGKKALLNGKTINDVVHTTHNFCNSDNKEIFICGQTGQRIKHPLFVGTVYYMALHHMVRKKCRSRNIGPVVKLTGQPTKGNVLCGGLRIGEMERDSIRSRSANNVLKDRMLLSCDMTHVRVCKSCGWLEPEIDCCENVHWINIQMSKTTRLLLMEMYSIGIFPKLHFC